MLNYKKNKVMEKMGFREMNIQYKVEENGRECRVIAVLSGNFLPKLRISVHEVDLSGLEQRLRTLGVWDIIVLGRNPEFCDVVVSENDRSVSCIHCYIRRRGVRFEVVDCSLNGTQVII